MAMYIDLTKSNEFKDKSHYKPLTIAWNINKYAKQLQKIIDKDFFYFTYYGKKENVTQFNLVKRDFTYKVVEKGTNLYKFLFHLCKKFIWISYENDISYFRNFIKEFENKKGYHMVEFEVSYYNHIILLKILKSQYNLLNFKYNSVIPIVRDTNNNLRLDYYQIDILLGNKPSKKWKI